MCEKEEKKVLNICFLRYVRRMLRHEDEIWNFSHVEDDTEISLAATLRQKI